MFGFLKRREPLPIVSAVIAAAGSSRRMNGVDKLFEELDGIPVIIRTLFAFEDCPMVRDIVLVCREELIPDLMKLTGEFPIFKLRTITKGGESRRQSVYHGFLACPDDAEYLCVHDGARPLVTEEVIAAAIEGAVAHGCATAAVPVKDTVKFAAGGFVTATPDRASLYQIQTPQVFRAEEYRRASKSTAEDFSDDCQLVEQAGGRVFLSQGDYRNLKITTPEDLAVAKALLAWEEES